MISNFKISSKYSLNWTWIIFGLILIFVVFVRLRLLDFPLERDEGEYAYCGKLILHGVPPYEIASNMKFPGTYYMYAFFMAVFGQTIQGIHLGLLIVNVFSIILLFLLTRKILSNYGALVASFTFALLSTNSSVYGFAGHATHFVILFALAGSLLLLKSINEDKLYLYFLSGLMFSLSTIMKQHGFLFCLFGFTVIIYFFKLKIKKSVRRLLWYSLGIFCPLAIMFILLMIAGVFHKFWFWTFKYGYDYVNLIHLNQIFFYFQKAIMTVTDGFYLVWIFSVFGIFTILKQQNLSRFTKLFLFSFLIFSFLNICPGFYFRVHYFITLLPAIAIFFALFLEYLYTIPQLFKKPNYPRVISISIFIVSVGLGLYSQFNYFFIDSTEKLSRQIYGPNPFPESIAIADYIKAHSNPDDKIAVIGSEPQIYFYADRLAATSYLYTYPLMEKHKYSLSMQKEMAREVEVNNPRYVILVRIPSSWLRHSDSETYILNWSVRFVRKPDYKLAGLIDIYEDQTVYKWANEALSYRPHSRSFIMVFEKRK